MRPLFGCVKNVYGLPVHIREVLPFQVSIFDLRDNIRRRRKVNNEFTKCLKITARSDQDTPLLLFQFARYQWKKQTLLEVGIQVLRLSRARWSSHGGWHAKAVKMLSPLHPLPHAFPETRLIRYAYNGVQYM